MKKLLLASAAVLRFIIISCAPLLFFLFSFSTRGKLSAEHRSFRLLPIGGVVGMRYVGLFFGVLLVFVLSFAQPKEPPKGARCVVCGMDVNMMPKFTSQLKLRSGEYVYTESPKHAIYYFLKNRDKVAELWVRDFSSGKWIDGTRAYYVVVDEGPMGPDVVAFRSLVEAKKFAKGKKVFRFRDIDTEFLKHLEMEHGGMKH